MKLRRAIAIGASVTALILATVACSTGSDGESDEKAGGTPDPQATFRFGSPLPITDLDPQHAPGAGTDTWLYPAYDRLVHLNAAGEAVPGLATEWKFNDDATSLELTLRPDVKFQDGEAFDAEAVKANIERGKTLEGSSVAPDLSVIEDVVVNDKLSITLNLARPSATLPLVLTGRPGAMISPAAFSKNLKETMVGAGMYKLTAFEPGVSASYERNDDYWDKDKVGVAKLEFTVITSSLTGLNALRSGEIDGTFLNAGNIKQAEASELKIVSKQTTEFIHLQLDRSRNEFGDVRVRQALNYAIDRNAIVKSLLSGLGEPAVQPFPPESDASDPTIGTDYYTYDPDKARQLLAEAGLPNGFDFELVTLNIDTYVKLAEIIQAQLKEIGVNAKIRQVSDISGECYVGQKCDSMPILWTGRPDPALTAAALFTSTGAANPGRHSVASVEKLYTKVLGTTEPAERTSALQELSAQITKEALDVVVYFPFQNAAFNKSVSGFEPWMSGKPEFRDVVMMR